jgi:hypothetical protein
MSPNEKNHFPGRFYASTFPGMVLFVYTQAGGMRPSRFFSINLYFDSL